LTVTDWYLGDQNHVDRFKTDDHRTLDDQKVELLRNAMAAFTPPTPAGGNMLPATMPPSLDTVLAAAWEKK